MKKYKKKTGSCLTRRQITSFDNRRKNQNTKQFSISFNSTNTRNRIPNRSTTRSESLMRTDVYTREDENKKERKNPITILSSSSFSKNSKRIQENNKTKMNPLRVECIEYNQGRCQLTIPERKSPIGHLKFVFFFFFFLFFLLKQFKFRYFFIHIERLLLRASCKSQKAILV